MPFANKAQKVVILAGAPPPHPVLPTEGGHVFFEVHIPPVDAAKAGLRLEGTSPQGSRVEGVLRMHMCVSAR